MLRRKGLTDKVLLLGVDGMDPRFTKRLVDEGKMPNVKKLMDMGSCRDDLMMLGANPTITPPMWATLATGAYPMTHGIMDYNLSAEDDKDITIGAFSSRFLKAEPLFNVTAKAGKKTLLIEQHNLPGGVASSFRRGRFEFDTALHDGFLKLQVRNTVHQQAAEAVTALKDRYFMPAAV